MGNGYAGQLKQIDLEEILLVCDELDLLNRPEGAFCGYSKVSRGLRYAGSGIVTETGKEGRQRIRAVNLLNVMRAKLCIQDFPNRLTHLLASSPLPHSCVEMDPRFCRNDETSIVKRLNNLKENE